MKKLSFLLPCFLFATLCTAAPLTDADKRVDEPQNQLPTLENLCEFAWLALDIPYEFSEEPYLGVVMYDIDHDGVPEALVTYKLWDTSGSGMNGRDWCGLRFKDGKWHFQFGDDSFGSSWGGFHVLTEEGQKPQLIASWNSYGNDGDGRHFDRNASRVTIDDEGRFKSLPFPEFEFTSKTYYDDDKEDDEIPALKLKSPNDKLESVPEGTVHHVLPLGKTVVFKHGESKHPKSAFVKDYVWQKPIKTFMKPDIVMANTATLFHNLIGAIVRKRSEVWYYHRNALMVPEKVEMFTLDLEGNGEPVFFVDTGYMDFTIGGGCYTIFKQTDPTTYAEIGHFRKGFIELALHEKTNGLHSIECRYPFGSWQPKGQIIHYIRELYVFDGQQYKIVVRSWETMPSLARKLSPPPPASSEIITPQMKEDLLTLAWADYYTINISTKFYGKTPRAHVLFIDANHDGEPAALLSFFGGGGKSEGVWQYFTHQKDGWHRRDKKNTGSSWGVEYHLMPWTRDDLYIVTKNGETPEFISIHVDRFGEGFNKKDHVAQYAYRLVMDYNNILSRIPYPELTRDAKKYLPGEKIPEFPIIQLKSSKDKIERAVFETFNPKADEKSPPTD